MTPRTSATAMPTASPGAPMSCTSRSQCSTPAPWNRRKRCSGGSPSCSAKAPESGRTTGSSTLSRPRKRIGPSATDSRNLLEVTMSAMQSAVRRRRRSPDLVATYRFGLLALKRHRKGRSARTVFRRHGSRAFSTVLEIMQHRSSEETELWHWLGLPTSARRLAARGSHLAYGELESLHRRPLPGVVRRIAAGGPGHDVAAVIPPYVTPGIVDSGARPQVIAHVTGTPVGVIPPLRDGRVTLDLGHVAGIWMVPAAG